MFYRSHIVLRVIGFIVLLGLLAGAGVMLFQAGQAQGMAISAAGGQVPAVPMPYPGYGYMRPHFFPFMGFFGIIPLLFGLFIVGGLFRMIFFRFPPMHHHGPWMNGPYGRHPWGWGPQPGEEEKTPSAPSAPEKESK